MSPPNSPNNSNNLDIHIDEITYKRCTTLGGLLTLAKQVASHLATTWNVSIPNVDYQRKNMDMRVAYYTYTKKEPAEMFFKQTSGKEPLFHIVVSERYLYLIICALKKDDILPLRWFYYMLCHEFYHYLDDPTTVTYTNLSEDQKDLVERSADVFARYVIGEEFGVDWFSDAEIDRISHMYLRSLDVQGRDLRTEICNFVEFYESYLSEVGGALHKVPRYTRENKEKESGEDEEYLLEHEFL